MYANATKWQHWGMLIYTKLKRIEDKLCAHSSAVLYGLTPALRYSPFTMVCEFVSKTWAHKCPTLCSRKWEGE